MGRDYNELFQEHLEMKLREGGPPQLMVSVAKIYEGDDSSLREYAFREWVDGEEFGCERCGSRFRGTADVKGEYAQVLCQACQKACKDA